MTKQDSHADIEELLAKSLFTTSSSLDAEIIQAISQALDDRTSALSAERELATPSSALQVLKPSVPSRLTWVRAAVAMSIALAIAVFVTGVMFFSSQPVAFAQVQDALRKVKTIQFERAVDVDDKRLGGKSTLQERGMIVEPDRSRFETLDGKHIRVTDRKAKRQLNLMTKERIAYVTEEFASAEYIATERRWQEWVRMVIDMKTEAKRIGEVEVGGHRAVEFFVKGDSTETTFLVDKTTRLPLRIETTTALATGSYKAVYTNLRFDEPIDESLFDTQPPAGYVVKPMVVLEGTGKDHKRKEVAAEIGKDWIVSPRTGIGPIRFGMSTEQIVAVLGRPGTIVNSNVSLVIGYGKPGEQIDPSYKPGPDEMMVRHKEIPVEVLTYGVAGIQLYVAKTEGLIQVNCVGQSTHGVSTLNFAGRTDKGIGLGASVDEVKESHESRVWVRQLHDGHATQVTLGYYDEGYEFEFKAGHLVRITVRDPERVGWGLQGGQTP